MAVDPSTIDPDALRAWMVSYICSVLDLPKEGFSTSARFDQYALDSVEAVIMAGVMEEEFHVEVDTMVFFENPSVDTFVAAFTAKRAAA